MTDKVGPFAATGCVAEPPLWTTDHLTASVHDFWTPKRADPSFLDSGNDGSA